MTGESLRGRAPYMPIHKRPKLSLPGGARVAVWTIVNVENWSPTGAMPRAGTINSTSRRSLSAG